MIKKIKPKSNNFNKSERYFGVVLESMDSNIKLLLEGHQALDKKIENNHSEFKEFRKEVNYKFDIVFDELHLIRNDLK